MAEKDITTNIEPNEADLSELKKAHFQQTGLTGTRIAPPVSQQPQGLNPELMNMLKLGKSFANFQGIDRCIRVLEPGQVNQRHCGAMMVKNLTMNQLMCSNCDRVKDINARPRTINSSMIRLSDKELAECGLQSDPLVGKQVVPEAASKPAKKTRKARNDGPIEGPKKRTPMKTPNKVSIEMSMEELKSDPNVLKIMLQKTLEAIYELPVSNFREAEAIRVVKERVESYLQEK